ncbi:MAG TPA: type II toxin-antitoxin system VapC family toxin [Candidatus Acidoferrales bacterium]|nr:type II toxin-antitoxin system VapC family toxin [Candidatus Acidoferrales bacterium]
MPGSVLLDTNAVIALFLHDKSALQQFADDELFLCAPVLGELCYGALKSAHPETNLERVEEFAASLPVLPCDLETARQYGFTKDRLRLKGRPIPENDIWVAAVAIQHGLSVASRDNHFAEVDGLHVRRW